MFIWSFKQQCVVFMLHSTEATEVTSLALGPQQIFNVDVKTSKKKLTQTSI